MPQLMEWGSFYVIVGSSAAALTGLMFVVMALIADNGELRKSTRSVAAFGTPTIVHFCEALLVSAALSAPWPTLASAGIFVDLCGGAGFVYCIIVVQRARRQTEYIPVLEDWLWHGVFPHMAYAAVIAGGMALPGAPVPALFAIAAATMTLVFIGIHNAWDTVTYVAIARREQDSGIA